MTDWNEIKTAPKDGTVILIAKSSADGLDVAAARWVDEDHEWKWRTFDGSSEVDGWHESRPTHWTEIPKGPA